nr:protein Gawky-like isoform X2 [Lepeophtheirus salmonis]
MTQEIQSTKEMGLEYLGPGDKGSRLRDEKSDCSTPATTTTRTTCLSSCSLPSCSCDKEARLSVIELTAPLAMRTPLEGEAFLVHDEARECAPEQERSLTWLEESLEERTRNRNCPRLVVFPSSASTTSQDQQTLNTLKTTLTLTNTNSCSSTCATYVTRNVPNESSMSVMHLNAANAANAANAKGKDRRKQVWIPSKGCVGMRDCASYLHSITRGSSWGGLRIGLLGGGDNSLSNGTSGWGPPPGTATGATGGWGTAPSAPNPIASVTWGNPNPSTSQMSSDDNSKSNAVIGPNPSSSPPGGGTSWAAAAGKGLPPSDASSVIPPASSSSATSAASNNGNGCPSTTKQQLEQLNSVREALFSQDGWGGSFVKQDTSWDTSVIGAFSGDSLQTKDSNNTFSTHNGRRNDGTEIWKVNLSGQPPAPKPQPSNPWGHTPQNPTDFKNWGEEDETHDVPSSSRNNINDPLWRGPRGTDPSVPQPPTHHHHQQPNGPSNQFGSSKDDWHNNGGGGPSNNWNDPRRDPSQNQLQPMASHPGQQQPPGRSDNSGPGWNGSAPPIRQVMNQWGSSNNPTNNGAPGSNFIRAAGGGWGATDGDSPTLSRRPVSHGGMDEGGTSLWGKIPPGPPVGGDRHERNNSNWQDMPTPTPTRACPPGPPNRLSMPSAPPVKDSSPWGGPIGHRVSAGWNDEPPMKPSGWGTPEVIDPMKQRDNGWSTDQWQNRPAGPPRQSQIRVSPNWDETTNDSSPTGWGSGQIKPRGSHLTKEFIWSSKQFRMLVEMGFDKNDIENALRRSHLNLEDAMDLLRYNNGVTRGGVGNDGLFNDPGSFDPMRGRFPPGQMFNYSNNAMDHSNTPGYASNFMIHNSNKLMNNGSSSIPPSNGPPRHPPQANNNQQPPSAQQLRILVQQIQMAVQAGHLNPQILNQPLAPQTLILLNQLLQQIKNLQALQLAHSQKSVNPQMPGALLVNITKTKQMILNLQNQISAQQANYLKQQQQQQTPSSHLGHDSPATLSGMSTMQDMFAGLGLNNGPIDSSSNNGSRLAQWKLTEDSFTKAPGGSSKLASSSNLLLDDGPWSNSAPGGWPEKQELPSSSSASNSSGAINGLDHFGISEFEPGKPWKGPGLKNPDDDPNLTPGSVAPSVLQMDVKVSAAASSVENNTLGLTTPTWTYSNKSENNAPKTSETWGQPQSSSLTPMGQDLWGKAGRSGPPGLVTSASNGIDKNWTAANSDGPTWLLLKNLTAQIDGATLKTLCLQHGPLKHFHLYLNHNLALVNYNSSREAAKAQKALNNCLLGNTTIMATSATDVEVSHILQQQQQQQQQGNGGSTNSGANNSNTATASDNGNRGSTSSTSSTGDMWGPIKSVAATSRASGESGSVWGNPLGSTADDQHRILLPGDLGI